MIKNPSLIFAFLILPFASLAQELTINFAGVKISFLADMQKTRGTISGLKAHIHFNADNLSQSKISGSVDVKTLDTGIPKRDEHLKSSDYFDAATYPTMTFKSGTFKQENGKYTMTGLMKIRDIERQETIEFTYENKVFKGETTIQAALYKIGNYADKAPDKTNVKIWFEIPIK